MLSLVLVVLALLAAGPARAAGDRPPEEVRPRVEYHVRHTADLASHFESILQADCPRFPSSRQWNAYVDSEVDRMVLLMAHLEQAWEEAKTTGDDDVRRAAKAPRHRINEARALVDKISKCAQMNGTELPVAAIWQRIQREVPRRQAEIALPR
jgi:hypothetical protein